ncbi:spermidine/putrescine ABC transporter substrate-binding protein [Leifsonia sp. YAF41]|uniref:spermidine/putrescine ABC transporter substrate-binding protein n=1 Tax=Leifsonia sp. YAF41 TaxID=3233086 RepID=UPI003F9B836C
MEGSIESRVSQEVDNWLLWLPRWRPGTHPGRSRLCRRCFGSPMMIAAGIARDVPHAVQHALTMRMMQLLATMVDEFSERNLPLVRREMRLDEERRSKKAYRPEEGLEPEYDGLDLDPAPVDGAPYLFTFGELAEAEEKEQKDEEANDALWSDVSFAEDPVGTPVDRVLSRAEEDFVRAKHDALKAELERADNYASKVGRKICTELEAEQERILAGVAEFIEPQVQALLADLDKALDSPLWPH